MKLNLIQRLAVLVALGVGLHVLCQAILFDDNLEVAQVEYSPGSSLLQSPLAGDKFSTIAQLAVFALHAGAWLVVALWLLRDRD